MFDDVNIDLKRDIAEINAGQALLLKGGNIQTSSGRIFHTHGDWRKAIYPVSGPGLVVLSQAEYSIYIKMVKAGGMIEDAGKGFDGMMNSGNKGFNASSEQRLTELFKSKRD